MEVIDGTGAIVVEPDWSTYLTSPAEQTSAVEHWRVVTTEMRTRNILSPGNTHAIIRLVLTYIVHDRAWKEASKTGAVLKPKRGSEKAIARVSPHFTVMKQAAATAAGMEAELGLSPRRRSSAATVEKNVKRTTGADRYLRRRGE